ncbi:JAB domain-containing protein [Comamonas composti]|uniref:JAB domain-containing protein n=1 Tax=Comamonas composti TaxID=408558 RepID=UPI0004056B4D|nr:JAB domain-containing protein [Comamonas composti]
MSLDLFPFSSHAAVPASLLVRDVAGCYRAADPAEVLQAALRVLEGQLRGSEVLSSPQAVRDFLRIKLATLEHEVFAVIHLDAQHRVIEYVEMFRGTVSQPHGLPVLIREGQRAMTWHETVVRVGSEKAGLLFPSSCHGVLAGNDSARGHACGLTAVIDH